MATWKPFSSNKKYYYTGPNFGYPELNKYYVKFEYDVDYTSPTKLKCRIVCGNDSWGSGYGTDYLYLWAPNYEFKLVDTTSGYRTQNFKIHDGTSREIPLVTPEFYLEKKWNDEYFTFPDREKDANFMPEIWICHQGRQAGSVGLGAFDPTLFLSGGDRETYVTKITDSTLFPKHDGYTPPSLSSSSGTLSVKDNGDNTFNVSGTLPPDLPEGNPSYKYPNKVVSAILDWMVDIENDNKSYVWYRKEMKNNSDEIKNKKFSYTYVIPENNTNNTMKLEATLMARGTYDNPSTSLVTNTLAYYDHPSWMQDALPTISYNTSRPTLHSIYEVNWDGMLQAMNNNSPVHSCTCVVQRINKNGVVDILLKKENILYANTRKLLFTSTQNSISGIDKVEMDVGDEIEVLVYPYTTTPSGKAPVGAISYQKSTGKITIANNNLIRVVGDDGEFKLGEVYVNTSKGWKESDGVFVKTVNGWKPSIE